MVTKQKGLKDILDLFTNNENEHAFLLKHWIKVFLSLSNDDDVQVREITLTTFKQINKLVKSLLSPYLKQILPHWLALTGDPHGNVAAIASDAFTSLFSKNKLNDAFLFSKEQIMNNVDSILFKINYTEKKNEIRLLPGAFNSLIVLSKISKDDQFIDDEFVKLLSNEQFWKYSKFNDNNVQSSWFNLINSLLLTKFDLIKSYITKINQLTFKRLGDKNVNLQESIFKVTFTLMKLDEENCFNELNYEKMHKSVVDIIKRNEFNQELLISNFDLILKYFLFKNEDKEELINSLFSLLQKEILNENDQSSMAINLYFASLLLLIQKPELLTTDQDRFKTILDTLINRKLKSILEQLSNNKSLQEIFKKLVSFSSSLKEIDCDQQVQLINDLILNSVKTKLNDETNFDIKSTKSLLNIIFNLKAFQSRRILNLIEINSVESLEFISYKFDFYESKTNDLSTKKELLHEILRIIFESTLENVSNDFIEFINYLVQFASYLDSLDDSLIDKFIEFFKRILSLKDRFNDSKLKLKLYYIIQQVILMSQSKFNQLDLNDSSDIFSFIFTLQLFKDSDATNLDVLPLYNVLYKDLENHLLSSNLNKLELDDLIDDTDGHDASLSNKEIDSKFISYLNHKTELDLLNAIHSLINLKLDFSIYAKIFSDLIELTRSHNRVNILICLILSHLNRSKKVLPVQTIECLIFKFIEFTNRHLIEIDSLWVEVLFRSLQDNSSKSTSIIADLSKKFKKMFLDEKSIKFDQLNLLISNIYAFIFKLTNLNEYSTNLKDVIENIILDKNEFDQLKREFNDKLFEFLLIKGDFTDNDFPANNRSDNLKIPHLVHVSYACLRISKLFSFVEEFKEKSELSLDSLINESTDQQCIVKLLENDSSLEYVLDYSVLSYGYLKQLNQIHSYGMSTNQNDLIESYLHFYEHIFSKINDKFIRDYVNRVYKLRCDDYWTVLSIHHLLNISTVDNNVFNFDEISKSLKTNNFNLIVKHIPKRQIELFLEQVIQYNLINKADYPNNLNDIQEYLNIISICLNSYLVSIDYETTLFPIANCIMNYQEKIRSKELDEKLLYLTKDQINNNELVNSVSSIINFLEQFLKRSMDNLNVKFSKLLFYSLSKWTEILNVDLNLLINNNHVCSYLNRLFSLINSLIFIMQLNTPNLREIRTNWLMCYSAEINKRLFKFFIKLSNSKINFVNYDLVNSLAKCLVTMDGCDSILNVKLQDLGLEMSLIDEFGKIKEYLKDDDCSDLKINSNFNRLFKLFAYLVMKKDALFSLTSHQLIMTYLELLADNLNHDPEFLTSIQDNHLIRPPIFFLNLLNKIHEQLDSESSSSNEQTYPLKIVYLLIWDQFLQFWSKLNEKIRNPIANYLKERGYLDYLFLYFTDILPIDKKLLELYYKHGLTKVKMMEYFQNNLQLEPSNLWSFDTLYHLGCQMYLKIFTKMPTTIRLWINTCAYQTQIKEFTSKFVSPIVIREEMRMIQDKTSNSFDGLKLTVRSSSNEIFAFYTFEDVRIELTLTLPTNYPIGLIKINCGDRVGVDLSKWRSWELQLTSFLAQVLFLF